MQYMIIIFLLSSMAIGQVRPQRELLVPLAKAEVAAERQFWRNPFDEHPNVRVNSDNSGQLQNEEQACISPVEPQHMVAVWRDFRLGYRRVGVGYSHDNGVTWHDELFPASYEPWQSDPCLSVDGDGVFTANVISFDPAQGGEDGLLDVSSYDGGVTWQDSVWAAYATEPVGFEDKQMITIDVSGSPWEGSKYVVWTHFYGENPYDSTHIWLVYKRPGEPYADPVIISRETGVQWANICVGPDGVLFVSWISYGRNGILFARSSDGGATWTQPALVQPTGFASANISPNLLIFAYGAMACDLSAGPQRGRLYMIFTDGVLNEDTDVFLSYSDDMGETWSARRRLNDDAENLIVDQFHPYLSVDELGRVWCVFYDRRNDPQHNLLMDLYFTASNDGGVTWLANTRISTVSSDPGAGALTAGLIGEYVGWCARHDKALAVWTDTRNGNQDAYSAVIDSVFETEAVDARAALQPTESALAISPNPFNGSATFTFSLARPAEVTLTFYNTLGVRVTSLALGELSSGAHEVTRDFSALASGLYLVRLEAGSAIASAKALLIK